MMADNITEFRAGTMALAMDQGYRIARDASEEECRALEMERFWSHVEKVDGDGCWLWMAALAGSGRDYPYFKTSRPRKMVRAHRWIYEKVVGPIPTGFQLDHLCRVKWCVRPSHLEAVTPSENTRRSFNVPRGHFHRDKTHCKQGHPYDEANTQYPKRGGRSCRACHRLGGKR